MPSIARVPGRALRAVLLIVLAVTVAAVAMAGDAPPPMLDYRTQGWFLPRSPGAMFTWGQNLSILINDFQYYRILVEVEPLVCPTFTRDDQRFGQTVEIEQLSAPGFSHAPA